MVIELCVYVYVSVCMCVTERHSPQVLDGSFDALQYDRSLFTPTQCLSVKTRERKRGKDGGRVAKREREGKRAAVLMKAVGRQ